MVKLFALEGIDGAGKTTIFKALQRTLPNVNTRSEPNEAERSGRWLREQISSDRPPEMDTLMFAAHHVEVAWRYAPTAGCDCYVTDRSSHVSMYAYQIHRLWDSHSFDDYQQSPKEWISNILAPIGRRPDHVIHLYVDVDTAIERVDGKEKYERREQLEQTKAYYDLMPEYLPYDPEWHFVDARGRADQTLDQVLAIFESEGIEVER